MRNIKRESTWGQGEGGSASLMELKGTTLAGKRAVFLPRVRFIHLYIGSNFRSSWRKKNKYRIVLSIKLHHDLCDPNHWPQIKYQAESQSQVMPNWILLFFPNFCERYCRGFIQKVKLQSHVAASQWLEWAGSEAKMMKSIFSPSWIPMPSPIRFSYLMQGLVLMLLPIRLDILSLVGSREWYNSELAYHYTVTLTPEAGREGGFLLLYGVWF